MKKNAVRSLGETNRSLCDCISNDFNIVAFFFFQKRKEVGENRTHKELRITSSLMVNKVVISDNS